MPIFTRKRRYVLMNQRSWSYILYFKRQCAVFDCLGEGKIHQFRDSMYLIFRSLFTKRLWIDFLCKLH